MLNEKALEAAARALCECYSEDCIYEGDKEWFDSQARAAIEAYRAAGGIGIDVSGMEVLPDGEPLGTCVIHGDYYTWDCFICHPESRGK